MARFIFFALIAALAWAWWSRQAATPPRVPKSPEPAAPPPPDVMVPCAHCGTHFPQKDGVSATQGAVPQWYCSSAHRDLGPRHQA